MKKSKLKRRLRKKYRVGEFREFGFQIEVKFKPDLSEADKIYDEFIKEIESQKLSFGGGSSFEYLHGFITAFKNYRSPTPVQREMLKNWLESRPEISGSQVGNLVDAWYDVD